MGILASLRVSPSSHGHRDLDPSTLEGSDLLIKLVVNVRPRVRHFDGGRGRVEEDEGVDNVGAEGRVDVRRGELSLILPVP